MFDRTSSLRALQRLACVGLLLACMSGVGCGSAPSIESLREQQKAGDYQRTLEPLRELLEANPDDGELNFLYGRALAYTTPNLAVWSLRRAMQDPDWFIPAGSQLALLALAGGDYNEVEKVTERLLERDPENQSVRLMRANAYAHSRKAPDAAIEEARRMLEIDPHAIDAYEPLILGLLGLDRFDEASEALAEAGGLLVEVDATEGVRAWHCATTATFDQESGDIDQARKTWERCLQDHPTSLDVVTNAVAFYDAQGAHERGFEILRAALDGDSSAGLVRTTLARRLFASGELGQAEALLLEAVRPDEPLTAFMAWLEIAHLRQAAEDYGAGADAYEHAIEHVSEIEAPSPQLLFEYADALLLADRLERAEAVAEDLPVPAHRSLLLARVAQERRDPARALAEFDEALRLWPDNPWARYYAALAAEELGDFDRALVEYRNSVRIDAAATDARTRGAMLLVEQGDPFSARTMLLTASDEAPLEIEGLLLGMHIFGLIGDPVQVADLFNIVAARHPERAGEALARAAEGLSLRSGPSVAVGMLAEAPGVNFTSPRFAPALRALVRFSHQAGATDAARDVFGAILDAGPDSSEFQEVRALDLELAGAPRETVRSAYRRALELDSENSEALVALGRLAMDEGDTRTALELFDRGAEADPADPEAKLGAARSLITSGRAEQAAARLDELLLEHPYEADAAALRVQLDLDVGVSLPATLERAQRAVRFRRDAEAYDLLSEVYARRNEPEMASRAAERAQALRELDDGGGS